jgi:hypothetical protein
VFFFQIWFLIEDIFLEVCTCCWSIIIIMLEDCIICSQSVGEHVEHHNLYKDELALKRVLREIFYHLAIPNDDFLELFQLCEDGRFCPSCLGMVEDVSRMMNQISTLKLLIQNKAESLGKLIASTPLFRAQGYGPSSSSSAVRSKRGREMWEKLRNPVIQSNFH